MRVRIGPWLLALAACSGGGGGGGTGTTTATSGSTGLGCASDADCASGQVCFAPGEPNCPVFFSCLQSGGCPTDQYCALADPAFPPCGDSECRDRCAGDADCRAGYETCDLGTGQCAPIQCDAGFTCGSHETCTPGAPVHGCVRDACTADADCAGGHCVRSACYDDPGFCSYTATN